MYDAIIGGGGPADLSAAPVLGRAQRRMSLCDNDEPRNRQVRESPGFLSGDRTEFIARLEGPNTNLDRVAFTDGAAIHRCYTFTDATTRQPSAIADELGLDRLKDGSVKVDHLGQSSVLDVFAAGDLARRPSIPSPGTRSRSPPRKASSLRSLSTSCASRTRSPRLADGRIMAAARAGELGLGAEH